MVTDCDSREKASALHLKHEKAIICLKQDTEETIRILLESRDALQTGFAKQSSMTLQSNVETIAASQVEILRALGNAQTVEMLLLGSLWFPTIDHRHIEIHDAHRNTFQWIFRESFDPSCGWSNFVQWLETGNGLYWINGKAGSGKSTLMKYIFDHEKTRRYLHTWAQNFELKVAGFFFWNSGTAEQRSQTGILRSLLYQILCKTPDLVRVVFPDEWSNWSAGTPSETPSKQWLIPVLKLLSDAGWRLLHHRLDFVFISMA